MLAWRSPEANAKTRTKHEKAVAILRNFLAARFAFGVIRSLQLPSTKGCRNEQALRSRQCASQPQGIQDHGERAEAHCGSGQHRAQQDTERRVEHARRDGDGEQVVTTSAAAAI